MRFVCVVTAVAAMSLIAADTTNEVLWSVEDAGIGKVPEGWSSGKTGKGPGNDWNPNSLQKRCRQVRYHSIGSPAL